MRLVVDRSENGGPSYAWVHLNVLLNKLLCDHCLGERQVQAESPRQLCREGYDFLVRHRLCPAPTKA